MGGSSYAVPVGYVITLSGFYGTGIGTASLLPLADPTAPYIGAAVDVSQHALLPLNLFNTNITALL